MLFVQQPHDPLEHLCVLDPVLLFLLLVGIDLGKDTFAESLVFLEELDLVDLVDFLHLFVEIELVGELDVFLNIFIQRDIELFRLLYLLGYLRNILFHFFLNIRKGLPVNVEILLLVLSHLRTEKLK